MRRRSIFGAFDGAHLDGSIFGVQASRTPKRKAGLKARSERSEVKARQGRDSTKSERRDSGRADRPDAGV